MYSIANYYRRWGIKHMVLHRVKVLGHGLMLVSVTGIPAWLGIASEGTLWSISSVAATEQWTVFNTWTDFEVAARKMCGILFSKIKTSNSMPGVLYTHTPFAPAWHQFAILYLTESPPFKNLSGGFFLCRMAAEYRGGAVYDVLGTGKLYLSQCAPFLMNVILKSSGGEIRRRTVQRRRERGLLCLEDRRSQFWCRTCSILKSHEDYLLPMQCMFVMNLLKNRSFLFG